MLTSDQEKCVAEINKDLKSDYNISEEDKMKFEDEELIG